MKEKQQNFLFEIEWCILWFVCSFFSFSSYYLCFFIPISSWSSFSTKSPCPCYLPPPPPVTTAPSTCCSPGLPLTCSSPDLPLTSHQWEPAGGWQAGQAVGALGQAMAGKVDSGWCGLCSLVDMASSELLHSIALNYYFRYNTWIYLKPSWHLTKVHP